MYLVQAIQAEGDADFTETRNEQRGNRMMDRGQQDIGGIIFSIGIAGVLVLGYGTIDAVLYGWEPTNAVIGIIGFLLMAASVTSLSRLRALDEGET